MSDAVETADQITQLVKAASISRLYWIDDKFGYRNTAGIARTIRTKIEVLWRLAPTQGLSHPSLATIPIGSDPDDVEARVRAALDAMSGNEDFSQELLNSVDQQIISIDSTYRKDIKDLSTSQFKEIEAAFNRAGAKVDAFSYNDWIDRNVAICADLNEDDLFFVDYDFSSEEGGTATTGEQILSSLLSQPKQSFICILFTHGVGKDEETSRRREIAERIGMLPKQHRFAVVSKESLTTTETGGGYAALTLAFKDAFLRDWCFSLAQQSYQIVGEAFTETTDAFLQLNVEELAAAFFRKPFSDGTLEADVLLRVFFLVARIKLQDRRHADAAIWKRLSSIRKLLAASPKDCVQSGTNKILQD
jgi:hypothetical protein